MSLLSLDVARQFRRQTGHPPKGCPLSVSVSGVSDVGICRPKAPSVVGLVFIRLQCPYRPIVVLPKFFPIGGVFNLSPPKRFPSVGL